MRPLAALHAAQHAATAAPRAEAAHGMPPPAAQGRRGGAAEVCDEKRGVRQQVTGTRARQRGDGFWLFC